MTLFFDKAYPRNVGYNDSMYVILNFVVRQLWSFGCDYSVFERPIQMKFFRAAIFRWAKVSEKKPTCLLLVKHKKNI